MVHPLKESIRRVGREAAEHQDSRRADAEVIARARVKFLGWVRSRPGADRRDASPSVVRLGWPRVGVAAAILFVAIGLSTMALPRKHHGLSFTIAGAPGVVGAWIVSSPVQFSDGSSFVLEREASARVVAVDEHGARVMLERGGVHASVVHQAASRWSIGAGPYEVRVTGTRFDVAWDPAARTFTLDLHEGSVVVTGCTLGERSVHAGESLRTTCSDGSAASTVIAAAAPTTETASAVVSAGSLAPLPPATAGPSGTVAASATPSASTWTTLARAGKFRDAYAMVSADLDALAHSVDAGDVLLLADVARYSGDGGGAKNAWLVLRTRFPVDSRAATAAFLLGRAAFDEGAFDDARRWLSTSLREAPSGPLACEATGRLIEACQRLGDAPAAKDAAGRYLRECPSGPHSKLAESVAEK